jgi:tetratricopeptide (TPR) repeat protein
MRLARKYGASQTYLASRAVLLTNGSLPQSQISLILNGRTRVERLEVWERIAAVLDMPDRARIRLGLAPLRTVEMALPDEDLEGMRRGLLNAFSASTLDEAMVEDWEQIAAVYGRATRSTPPSVLLRGLTKDFADLERQLEMRQPARLQRRLYATTARIAGLASLLLTNVGRYGEAQQWGRVARLAATEAADLELASWVRAQDAYAIFYQGDSFTAAAEVANHAQRISRDKASVGVALAAALEARARARLGEQTAAVRAIKAAEGSLSRLDAHDQEPSAFGYNEAQLRFHEGNVYTHLGQPERALALYPKTEVLDRTLIALDRAIALAIGNNLDQSIAEASATLDSLTTVQRTELIVARARQLRTIIAAADSTYPGTKELESRIIESETTARVITGA